MTNLLEIHDLLIERDRKTVLEVEHLNVHVKEVLGVIGPNGAGKSTLLLAISHLIKPVRGQKRNASAWRALWHYGQRCYSWMNLSAPWMRQPVHAC
jgi:ABC-type Mn2+/Zn2+ transport system ATPase subunit